MTQRTLEDLLKYPKLPARLARIALGKLDETPAIRAVRDLIAGKGQLAVLAGSAGCGKSVAGAFACAEVIGSRFVAAPVLAKPDDALDRWMIECRLLVLDDLGTEYVTEKAYAVSRVEAAIVAREAAERPTLVTTNLLPDAFRERYGDRIASRINGDPIGWISLPSVDLRRKGAA